MIYKRTEAFWDIDIKKLKIPVASAQVRTLRAGVAPPRGGLWRDI